MDYKLRAFLTIAAGYVVVSVITGLALMELGVDHAMGAGFAVTAIAGACLAKLMSDA